MEGSSGDRYEESPLKRLAQLEQKDRSKTAWLTVSWILIFVTIIALAFTMRVTRYQGRKIDELTKTVNTQKDLIGTKVDRPSVERMISIKFDTVSVVAARLVGVTRQVDALRSRVAAVDDHMSEVHNDFLKRHNHVIAVTADEIGRLERQQTDSLAAFRQWMLASQEESEQRFGRAVVAMDEKLMLQRLDVDRLKRKTTLMLPLGIINLVWTGVHTADDSHHGK